MGKQRTVLYHGEVTVYSPRIYDEAIELASNVMTTTKSIRKNLNVRTDWKEMWMPLKVQRMALA